MSERVARPAAALHNPLMLSDYHIYSKSVEPVGPLEALGRVTARDAGDVAMLHSGLGGGYSVLAFDPLRTVVAGGGDRASAVGALEALGRDVAAVRFEAPHPLVGWLGFLSYELGERLESIGGRADARTDWPLVRFSLYRHYLIFDHAAGAVTAYTLAAAGEAPADPRDWLTAAPTAARRDSSTPARIVESPSKQRYFDNFQRAQAYLSAGDIYQVNLAQRWVVETPADPAALFQALCNASPAPFSSFLRFTDRNGIPRHVLSASPELFLTQDAAGHLVTRPIKGTRPRDPHNPERDAALRDELLASSKDQAELAMIVDLLRNDVGRVARFGSVQVTEPRGIEQHPTVWHTVATIDADLRPHASLVDLLTALCPGGSITGAPKIRAMQIIRELEPAPRSLYCGNIGVIGPEGKTVALNIAIRTLLLEGGRAQLFAGGGIVADSEVEAEYQETLHKAAALFRALGVTPEQ